MKTNKVYGGWMHECLMFYCIYYYFQEHIWQGKKKRLLRDDGGFCGCSSDEKDFVLDDLAALRALREHGKQHERANKSSLSTWANKTYKQSMQFISNIIVWGCCGCCSDDKDCVLDDHVTLRALREHGCTHRCTLRWCTHDPTHGCTNGTLIKTKQQTIKTIKQINRNKRRNKLNLTKI